MTEGEDIKLECKKINGKNNEIVTKWYRHNCSKSYKNSSNWQELSFDSNELDIKIASNYNDGQAYKCIACLQGFERISFQNNPF